MSPRTGRGGRKNTKQRIPVVNTKRPNNRFDTSKLSDVEIPTTYNDIHKLVNSYSEFDITALRFETLRRIKELSGVPTICYVSRTHDIPEQLKNVEIFINDGDLTGFSDLVSGIDSKEIYIFIISNGGIPESADRIVRLIRKKFEIVKFIVPANAYSAATLMCLSGDEVIIDDRGILGPIDPQIRGVPARAILRGFENIKKQISEDIEKSNKSALPVYLPLLQKLDIHLLEMCISAQELSKELAIEYLSSYCLKCPKDTKKVIECVEYITNYDIQKSHSRSLDIEKLKEFGIPITPFSGNKISNLFKSLNNQYELFFDLTPFYKVYESSEGIAWGRKGQEVKTI